MEATLQEIFSQSFSHYAKGKSLPHKYYKAANAIIRCRTPSLGGHLYRCPQDHEQHIQYHSCKHRSCPLCNAFPKAKWVASQQDRLLACDHYHVIFTLPHELLDLWKYNSHWFADQMFQVCRDTLMTLLKDPKHLGALPGLLMTLHTWGRTLSLHPHIHCLVTGGGLDDERNWRATRYDYLLPVAVVKSLFKGKLLARLWDALAEGRLDLPPWQKPAAVQRLLRQLNEKSWNVRLQERYTHGRGVMLYLSRYVKGGALSNDRIDQVTQNRVTFRYKDHHDNTHKTLTLKRSHFMERVLWHVPESGQHTVRHCGLYSHRSRAKRNLCRPLLGQGPEPEASEPLEWQRFLSDLGHGEKGKCSQCGRALLRCQKIGATRRHNQNSINKWAVRVQQAVRPDPAPGIFPIRGPT